MKKISVPRGEKRGKGGRGFFRGVAALFKIMWMVIMLPFRLISLLLKGAVKAAEVLSDRVLSLFRFNIAFKLTIGFALIIALFTAAINIGAVAGARQLIYSQSVKELQAYTRMIEADFEGGKVSDVSALVKVLDAAKTGAAIVGKDGEPLYVYGYDDFDSLEAARIASDSGNMFFIGSHIYHIQDLKGGTLVLRKHAENEQDLLSAVAIASTLISFLIFMLCLSFASGMSKKQLRPIYAMTDQVRDISTSRLSARLDIRGTKDELKDLAATFNKLMDEIEASYENQRRFVSDASHELRTPIAVIKGYADMLARWGASDQSVLEEGIDAIKDEAQGMQSLVESLLFIARSDRNTLNMEKAEFNISELMDEIIKETRLIDSDHAIEGQVQPGCMLYGNHEKIKQAIRIFVDNSIRYTPAGGGISISLRASGRDAVINVRDSGIGIASEDLPRIFERFYRADKSRSRLDEDKKSSGSGLGLSIAKIIIDAHRGSIHVQSKQGEGTEFTIILPLKHA
ncbi:signal transduction histidine-protein kinase ArlS (plasmid) [Peptoclostridium acidaminophilum DSM 3953]|uniref:histidine kinase n=1 Tax=Peptoclostridium acidaminophilum DSM 3953 TaxID=1286171 RepID=W8TJX3_PEPAC|nr:HAMP domain-containing sensor histidine kinase [Peptoclostridium acidaminophilum]AHM58063.1 signal transduction histidine-protein kinase ArlS [Peptoclostridium acidaminophilum DSM 3953]